jgi:hypothetical protein
LRKRNVWVTKNDVHVDNDRNASVDLRSIGEKLRGHGLPRRTFGPFDIPLRLREGSLEMSLQYVPKGTLGVSDSPHPSGPGVMKASLTDGFRRFRKVPSSTATVNVCPADAAWAEGTCP